MNFLCYGFILVLFINAIALSEGVRRTQVEPTPYYRTNDVSILGAPNFTAAIGNPLKGLAGGPRYSKSSPLPNSVPSAIEFYNVGLDEIMIGDNQFNWTLHDQFLRESASRRMHAVLSVYIHWPGRPLRLPPHLLDIPLYDTDNGKSPNYGEPRLLTALQQFIVAWGRHTDGDPRVIAIHVGLLGFWGEGHTYPDTTLVPESSKQAVAQWYRDSFRRTQIQARYPGPNAVGFGLYDGSLAYSTLDGAANGGKVVSWFTYPQMKKANQVDMWKQNIIGGETRPELQKIIFTATYPARTEYHQDYKECIDTLHVSYALHHDAFQNGGYTGDVLRKANEIHAYMGYAFYVSEIAAYATSQSESQTVDVAVQITQLGVAPFYYDLKLVLDCDGLAQITLPGVEEITLQGQSKGFMFRNVPNTEQCLQRITLYLQSSYAYTNRPIRFAQGINGTVVFSLPRQPIQSVPTQVPVPIVVPTQVPVPIVVPTQVPVPIVVPTPVPVPIVVPTPVPVPVRIPTQVPAPIVVPTQVPVPIVVPTPVPVPVRIPTLVPVPIVVPTQVPVPVRIPTQAPVPIVVPTIPSPPPINSPQIQPIQPVPALSPVLIPAPTPVRAPAVSPPSPTQISSSPILYFTTNNTSLLGAPNITAAIGNPLKGLAGGPRYSKTSPLPNKVPSSIEFYNIGLNEIMIGNNRFNWALHDRLIKESASRRMHAVLSVYIHWPGQPLRLPPHLSDLPLYDTNNGKSPNYGDLRLLTALKQFIVAWGKRTDGDTRVAAIHVGLLGFWGEGHTYPDTTLVPESSKQIVAQWYRDCFRRTQIQARYPGPNADGFGLYDASLAYSTLDGVANGGKEVSWFMYPQMLQAKQENTWEQHIIGGETRSELQKIIFTDTYPARTENHQDYKECVDTLHISYALHHDAFQNGGYTGDVLRKANEIHAYMGYAFYVSEITAYASPQPESQTVDIAVQVTQIGVAPFYYDLKLVLDCDGLMKITLPGVDEISLKGQSKSFLFRNVPKTKQCLDKVVVYLVSTYAYDSRPIRFAQGTDGKLLFALPLPPSSLRAFVLPAGEQSETKRPLDHAPIILQLFQRIMGFFG